jgi:hypothetical protein
MDSRLAAEGLKFSPSEAGGGNLPQQVMVPFSEAMAQSMLLPAGVLLIGLAAALSFARPVHQRRTATEPREQGSVAGTAPERSHR